jgi:two-component system, NarL family, response regulator LiaR
MAWVDIRRIVVVDDHEMFTEALAVSLSAEQDLRVVGRSTPNDPRLPDRLARLRPDVVTVDAAPAGGNPATVVGLVSAARPDAKLVVLTASREVQHVIDAARAGADAWLSKECSSAELVATIRAVCAGHTCYPSLHLGAVLRALAAGARPADDALSALSGRERCVLAAMVDGLSGPDIAVRLRVSAGTVRSHTQRIFTKLGVRSRLEAVKVARSAPLVHAGCSCSRVTQSAVTTTRS